MNTLTSSYALWAWVQDQVPCTGPQFGICFETDLYQMRIKHVPESIQISCFCMAAHFVLYPWAHDPLSMCICMALCAHASGCVPSICENLIEASIPTLLPFLDDWLPHLAHAVMNVDGSPGIPPSVLSDQLTPYCRAKHYKRWEVGTELRISQPTLVRFQWNKHHWTACIYRDIHWWNANRRKM